MLKFQISDEIQLRPVSDENAAEIFATVKENFEHLRPFLHWVTSDYSFESVKQFIVESQKASAEKERQNFGIFFNRKFVGAVGFVHFNWNSKNTEIGYWIDKDFEGNGIITKSCQALIKYAFEELKMNRIEIHCAAENVKSRAVPERLDFKQEGMLRQSEWRHTRFYDMAIYGLLKTDWIKKK
ncbi:GNAT family protein [soil metagenome]